MLREVEDLEELEKQLVRDKSNRGWTVDRYPVRFIFVDSFEQLRRVTAFCKATLGADSRELTEIVGKSPDRWPTPTEVVDWIRSFSRDTVAVPLSEYLRFLDTDAFFGTMSTLCQIEARKPYRVYLPMVGMWSRFDSEFWRSFYRRDEWAPVFRVTGGDTPQERERLTVYHIKFALPLSQLANRTVEVSTVKQWLDVWKRSDVRAIISVSKSLSYFFDNFLPDETFDRETIDNPKDYLQNIVGIDVPWAYHHKDEANWKRLLMDLVSSRDKIVFGYVSKKLNVADVRKLGTKPLLERLLLSSSDYERWLLKKVITTRDDLSGTYLFHAIKRATGEGVQSILRSIWFEIFSVTGKDKLKKWSKERRELLNIAHKELAVDLEPIESEIADYFGSLDQRDPRKMSVYLTGLTFHERKLIVQMLSWAKPEDIWGIISEDYPGLYYYLSWKDLDIGSSVPEWIRTYMFSYTLSKATETLNPKVRDLIEEKNKSKESFANWYYDIEPRQIEASSELVWIDGLGAEWLPYLTYVIEKYGSELGWRIKDRRIARANLPTVTECNRMEGQKFDDFDRYVHSQRPYRYPDDLVKELEIVEELIKKALALPGRRLIITGDHGMTALCRKGMGNSKELDFAGAEHDGRCVWIGHGSKHAIPPDTRYYVVWKIENDQCSEKGEHAIIALKHVSLKNVPIREVHGGATPEEVLVPWLVLERLEGSFHYRVEPMQLVARKTAPLVQFRIIPKPLVPCRVVTADGKPLPVKYNVNENRYEVDVSSLRPGTYDLIVKIAEEELSLKNVEIIGGFRERDLI